MGKEPRYLPKVALARLKTATDYEKVRQECKGEGFTAKEMKAMVRCMNHFDGLLVYVSKRNWDNHEKWHLYNWSVNDDEKVMQAIYEAEQFNPFSSGYVDDFEGFKKDWKNEAYDPGAVFSFTDEQVEVVEVVQEEVDNIDRKAVAREIKKAENARRERRRRQRAAKGVRYRKKYF